MSKKKYFKLNNCDIQSNDIMRNGQLIGFYYGLNKKLRYRTKIFDNFFKSILKLSIFYLKIHF